MVDTNAIRKYMVDNGRMTVTSLAAHIGKSPATVGRWLEIGVMPTVYAELMADILKIPEAKRYSIFFNGVLPERQQNPIVNRPA